MSSKNFSVRMAFASDKVLPPVKRLYVPFTAMITAHFNNFLWSSDFFADNIPAVRKNVYLCPSYLFVL